MGHEKRRYFNLNKRYQILLSKGKKCQCCAREITVIEKKNRRYCIYELDHIVPLSRNGPDNEHNLCVLCLECHRIKFLHEILAEKEQCYCLRHKTYYNDDTHGASCFYDGKKDEVAPVLKSLDSFQFTCNASPESQSEHPLPSLSHAYDQSVKEILDNNSSYTWAQRASVCLP